MKHSSLFVVTTMLLLAGAGCTSTTTTTTDVYQPKPMTQTEGRAVFTVTDDAVSLQNVTSVMLNVDKLEVHSVAQGWVTVSTTPRRYDLLQLKSTGSAQLLADANLTADTYDQIRLNVTKVEATISGKTEEVKLPSNSLKIMGTIVIVAGQTTTIELDFLVDKSLHVTGNGKYIFTPVIQLEVKDEAVVRVKANEQVETEGGRVKSDQSVGMDEKGEMKAGFELKNKLMIDAGGMIRVEN